MSSKCWIHRILQRDIEARTGICEACGPVRLTKKGLCANKQKQMHDDWNSEHPDWHRNGHYMAKFGVNAQDIRDLLEKQGNCCALCGATKHSGKNWHVDHDHLTGKIRAVLCHHCNTGLGNFKDNPELLRKAAGYLERHG